MTLKTAYNLTELAYLLGCKAQQLGYYIYKRPLAFQYKTFHIPKKRGGTRIISAPATNLKIIQRNIARELDSLRLFKPCVNGFVAGRDIRRNAEAHVAMRFVLNIDLEDFLGQSTLDGCLDSCLSHRTLFLYRSQLQLPKPAL